MKTLRQLREGYGLTQTELAELFSVSPRTIQNLEKDSSNIKNSMLEKYLRAFNVKFDDIFLGKEYEIFEFQHTSKTRGIDSIRKRLNPITNV